MGLKKCPRCELNYILDDGDLCTVCREEVRGQRAKDDAVTICSLCGEMPALPGEDMCKACMAEIRSIEILATDEEDEAVETAELDPEPVSSLDEIEAVEALEGEDMDEELDEESDEQIDEDVAIGFDDVEDVEDVDDNTKDIDLIEEMELDDQGA